MIRKLQPSKVRSYEPTFPTAMRVMRNLQATSSERGFISIQPMPTSTSEDVKFDVWVTISVPGSDPEIKRATYCYTQTVGKPMIVAKGRSTGDIPWNTTGALLWDGITNKSMLGVFSYDHERPIDSNMPLDRVNTEVELRVAGSNHGRQFSAQDDWLIDNFTFRDREVRDNNASPARFAVGDRADVVDNNFSARRLTDVLQTGYTRFGLHFDPVEIWSQMSRSNWIGIDYGDFNISTADLGSWTNLVKNSGVHKDSFAITRINPNQHQINSTEHAGHELRITSRNPETSWTSADELDTTTSRREMVYIRSAFAAAYMPTR